MDAITEIGSVDWSVLVSKENEGFLGYIVSKPLPKVNPLLQIRKSSRDRSSHDSSKIGSPRLSWGGASSKRRHFHDGKGPSHRSSSKKMRMPPPVPSDVEGEEREASLSHKPSRHRVDSGQCFLL